jgi:hypothetical protein
MVSMRKVTALEPAGGEGEQAGKKMRNTKRAAQRQYVPATQDRWPTVAL